MLTIVGKDQPGIVAKVTAALFKTGCNLGETSMLRLGGNFTMMLMVQTDSAQAAIEKSLTPVANNLALHFHVDKIEGKLHDHREPDVRISVYGADRIGIVAQVTGKLSEAGLDIFDLESDVAGTDDKPVYIMHIEGRAEKGPEALRVALHELADQGIQAQLQTIDTIIG